MKTYPMRCRIRNEGSGPVRIDIFDDIGQGGFFSEGYTAASFADAVKGVSGPLDIHINSAGGDVNDGIAIASAIRNYPGRKRTIGDGIVASAATVIFVAGDECVAEPGSMYMVHDPFTGMVGNQADFLKIAETLGKYADNIADQYAAKSGKPASHWRDLMRAETWFKADEAVESGLADRVGSGAATLPQGVDLDELAAFAPGRVMAALRLLPKAASGDGGGDGAMSGQKCKTCKGTGRLKHPVTGKPGVKCPSCSGSGRYDPDGDGDDDSTADGDTDHDYVEPDGSPGPAALTEERVRAIFREELRPALAEEVRAAALEALRNDAKVDDSPWDASKAWAAGSASDDPEAFFRAICAGEKTTGEPDTQAHWALPYRYSPDSPPNAAAVRNGLARLAQTQDLKDPDGTKKKLEGLMKDINPDYEPEDSGKSVFSLRLEQMRGALPPLKGAGA